MIGLYIAAGVVYGAHVLSCIAPEMHWLAPVDQSRFMAVVHGALLAALVVLGFRPAEILQVEGDERLRLQGESQP
jgi:hypothetical protein